MCGIAGYFNTFNYDQRICSDLSNSVIDSIRKRGPDSHGTWNNSFLYLLHSRLSIIDISENANQPMISKNGRYILVFNGEIYNFKTLKKNYLQHQSIKSSGDTEVIIQLFEKFGVEDTIKLLNGMFSIGVYDNLTKNLFLIRDRTGQKPLYYYFDNTNFCFSSELSSFYNFKDIDLRLNITSFNEFLRLGYFPQKTSSIKNIKKVLPGTYIKVTKIENKFHLEEKKWLEINNINKKKNNHNFQNEISHLNEIFLDVIGDNLVSDVDRGVFLSSGIDSTLIACYSKIFLNNNLNTFTIGFENSNFDESLKASKTAKTLNSNHNDIQLKDYDVKESILKMNDIYSEPFGDTSQIPTYLLSKHSSNFIKVALAGDGGDELFGGYNRYQFLNYIKLIKRIGIDKIFNFFNITNKNFFINFIFNSFQSSEDKISKVNLLLNKKINTEFDLYKLMLNNHNYQISQNNFLLNDNSYESYNYDKNIWNSNLSFSEKMMESDFINYLPDDLLVKTDRASMYSSMEIRSPFLDNRVLDFSKNLNIIYKTNIFNKKIILKKLVKKYFNINVDSNKKGFAIPLNDYLSNDLSFLVNKYLDLDKVNDQKIFNPQLIKKVLEDFNKKEVDLSKIIWNLISLQRFIDNHEKNCNKLK